VYDVAESAPALSPRCTRIVRPSPSSVVIVTPSGPVFVCVTGVTFCAE
jgi:hypothetical protein